MKTIVTIIGARPQFIKAVSVSNAIKKHKNINEIIVHTGQHYDDNMSGIFFREMGLRRPDYNLNVGSGTHAVQTGEMMRKLEPLLLEIKPHWILLYGDTNSTIAGALTAAKMNIPIAHVESGLRSFNRSMPEEINRIVTDRLSQLLFCPTRTAVGNLKDEGIKEGVHLTGDVMYDAALFFGKAAAAYSKIQDTLGLKTGQYMLATVHRAENTDNPERLGAILRALAEINKNSRVIMPLHPRTRKQAAEYGFQSLLGQIQPIDPVGFLDMITLEKNARVIITDSGGVQKEAYFHGVPCVTVRDETEWVETVQAGWNQLANAMDSTSVIRAVQKAGPGMVIEDYGTGNAAEVIVRLLSS